MITIKRKGKKYRGPGAIHRAIREAVYCQPPQLGKGPIHAIWPLLEPVHAPQLHAWLPDAVQQELMAPEVAMPLRPLPHWSSSCAPSPSTQMAHMVGYQWSSLAKATENFTSEEIWLASPQFYEINLKTLFLSPACVNSVWSVHSKAWWDSCPSPY